MVFWLDRNDFGFFSSTNLTHWTRMSTVTMPGVIECPDLFELPVDGDRKNTRWVFCAGGGRYFVGAFDGTTFTPQSEVLHMSAGNCFAVAQTFSDVPAADGRRLMIVHGTAAFPGMPFNRLMNFPLELTLRTSPAGIRLCSNPVREIRSLYRTTNSLPAQDLAPGGDPLAGTKAEFLDISTEFEPKDAAKVTFTLRGWPVVYDARAARLVCQDRSAPLPAIDGRVRLRFLVDRGILEIYGNDGLLYMPMRVPPENGSGPVGVSAQGATARLVSWDLNELGSTW
jgi:fructan beta-fructosidase